MLERSMFAMRMRTMNWGSTKRSNLRRLLLSSAALWLWWLKPSSAEQGNVVMRVLVASFSILEAMFDLLLKELEMQPYFS